MRYFVVLALSVAPSLLSAVAPPQSAERLIRQLDDYEFETRQEAEERLIQKGSSVAPLLWRTIDDPASSFEQRTRARRALWEVSRDQRLGQLFLVERLTRHLESLARNEADLVGGLRQLAARFPRNAVKNIQRFQGEGNHGKVVTYLSHLLARLQLKAIDARGTLKVAAFGQWRRLGSEARYLYLESLTPREIDLVEFLPPRALLPNGMKVEEMRHFGIVRACAWIDLHTREVLLGLSYVPELEERLEINEPRIPQFAKILVFHAFPAAE